MADDRPDEGPDPDALNPALDAALLAVLEASPGLPTSETTRRAAGRLGLYERLRALVDDGRIVRRRDGRALRCWRAEDLPAPTLAEARATLAANRPPPQSEGPTF
ncbi:MAG: hypothetical protein OXG35_12030 [Acidobacteria bacterium]|nr:hypothetical protein [Acidobacteriota bacterium]